MEVHLEAASRDGSYFPWKVKRAMNAVVAISFQRGSRPIPGKSFFPNPNPTPTPTGTIG